MYLALQNGLISIKMRHARTIFRVPHISIRTTENYTFTTLLAFTDISHELSLFIYLFLHLTYIDSLVPVAPTLEHRASVKHFASLQFLNPKTVGRTPWTGISLSQGRYLHTEYRINANRHPCLEWDLNPWPQCSSEWRQVMPWTTRPLWSASYMTSTS
jgi:hypothetical protein